MKGGIVIRMKGLIIRIEGVSLSEYYRYIYSDNETPVNCMSFFRRRTRCLLLRWDRQCFAQWRGNPSALPGWFKCSSRRIQQEKHYTYFARWYWDLRTSVAVSMVSLGDTGSISSMFHQVFAQADLKSKKRHLWLDCLFVLLGSFWVKDERKQAGEIDL